jgi:hypothetical protein
MPAITFIVMRKMLLEYNAVRLALLLCASALKELLMMLTLHTLLDL